MSSACRERWATPVPLEVAYIVAPNTLEWPRPRAWPYSWVATPCRSLRPAGRLPGPSSQTQSE